MTGTRRPDPHEAFEELAVGYALHALEPEDEQRFLAHLAGCARCERELAEHVETAAELAYAAEPVDLPDGLLESLRAETARTPAASRAREVVDLDEERQRRRSARRASRYTAAAAGLVLVVGLAGWNVALQQDAARQQQVRGELAAAVRALSTGPGRTVPLRTQGDRVAAVAVLQDNRVSLVVHDLQPNDLRDSQYVLWQQGRYGDLRPVASFDVRPSGSAGGVQVVADLPLHGQADAVAALAVTHEPGRRAPARPGQTPVAVGEVRAA